MPEQNPVDETRKASSNLKRSLSSFPLHPMCLAATFVLSAAFANDISLAGYIRPLVIAVGVALVITGTLILATRSHALGGLLTTAIGISLLSLQPLQILLEFLADAAGPAIAFLVVGLVAGASLFGISIVLLRSWRQRAARARYHRIAQQAGLVLLASVVLTGAISAATSWDSGSAVAPPPTGCGDASLPDIYHVMLDGYPGASTLRDRFHFDNGDFLDELQALGFAVPEDSHSNYTYTALTLASMLNERYLSDIPSVAPIVGTAQRGRAALIKATRDAVLFDQLHGLGYETFGTSSGWEHVTLRGAVDHFLDHGQVTDFERNVFERTWLPEILRGPLGSWVMTEQAERISAAINDVEDLAAHPQAAHQFVYAHLPIPHRPLVYNRDGTVRSLFSMRDFGAETQQRSDDQYGPALGDELTVLNKMVVSLIRQIQSTDRGRNAVIIVMSDHGYTHDWREVIPRERLTNLLAVYAPGHESDFDRDPTLVNLYRRISRIFLGACVGELPDRYFVSVGAQEAQLLTEEVGNPDSDEVLVTR